MKMMRLIKLWRGKLLFLDRFLFLAPLLLLLRLVLVNLEQFMSAITELL